MYQTAVREKERIATPVIFAEEQKEKRCIAITETKTGYELKTITTMTTDFTPEAPHQDYECTLHIRGTKAWFQTIRDLLDTAVPEDEDQAHAKDFLHHEVEEVINWINQHEGYYKKITNNDYEENICNRSDGGAEHDLKRTGMDYSRLCW